MIIVDVGHCFDLYADFTQAGKAYLPFPDPKNYRISLADLAREDVRELLRGIWTNPLALDPARKSAAVTRELAGRLAKRAKLLEKDHDAQAVSAFLMRCLFTMFAEDIELLAGKVNADGTRQKPFTQLLREHQDTPEIFARMVESLWQAMDRASDRGHGAALQWGVVLGDGSASLVENSNWTLVGSGGMSSPPSSAPCSNGPLTQSNATNLAPITPPAPMWSDSSCPP